MVGVELAIIMIKKISNLAKKVTMESVNQKVLHFEKSSK